MKQKTKIILCLLLSTMLLLSISGINVFAESQTTMSVTLRIEGINANMFNKTVEVPYTDSLTLQNALIYIDMQEQSISITGIDSGYIADINGDTAGKFGGYDGWLYTLNGTEPTTGIEDCPLNNGDSIVLYYGDPYGVGMQYPVADTSNIANGIIKFTSSDTTYDASYNPTVTVNPVVGAIITWNYENTSATYTTDTNGEITINNAQLTEGSHIIQIAKFNDAGLPLVLRFAPDYSVTIAESSSKPESSSNVTSGIQSDNSDAQSLTSSTQAASSAIHDETNPKTGDESNTTIFFVLLLVAVTGIFIIVQKGHKHSDEK